MIDIISIRDLIEKTLYEYKYGSANDNVSDQGVENDIEEIMSLIKELNQKGDVK